MKLHEKIAAAVFLLSLLATVTNLVPLSISFCILVVLLPLYLRRFFQQSPGPVLLLLILLYGYFLVSALLYAPAQLMQPDFYRRDGNFFVTFLPLLLLGVFRLELPQNLPLEKVARIFVLWATAFLFCAWLIRPTDEMYTLHHISFITHNAAGGFTAVVLALAAGFSDQWRQRYFLLVSLVLGFLLLATGSRGSILALGVAFVQVVVLRERWNRILVAAALLLLIGVLLYGYPIWVESGRAYSEFTSEALSLDITRGSSIINRLLYLWPRALDNFLKSPLFGQGFGSYNDIPYAFRDTGLFVLNTGGVLTNSDAHAHNSFLHLLSETGLAGLALMVLFLAKVHALIANSDSAPGLKDGMLTAFWVVIWSSFTEHRLTTPSQMLPFMIILGFMLAAALRGKRTAGEPAEDACGTAADGAGSAASGLPAA